MTSYLDQMVSKLLAQPHSSPPTLQNSTPVLEKKSRKRPISTRHVSEFSDNERTSTEGTFKSKHSLVWAHYDESASKTDACCRKCFKSVRTKDGSTSGLIRHLKSGHNIDIKNARFENGKNTPPYIPGSSTSPLKLPVSKKSKFEPIHQSKSFDPDLEEFIAAVRTRLSCSEFKLRDLLTRLQTAYLTVSDNSILLKIFLNLGNSDSDCDLETSLAKQIAAKYGIPVSSIEDASLTANTVFFGTVHLLHINAFIQNGDIGGKECFSLEDKELVEKMCKRLIAADFTNE